jgi:hypothetical protein
MNTPPGRDKKVESMRPSRHRRRDRYAMEAIRHIADIDPSDLDNFDEPELPTFIPRVHKRTLKG